MARGRQRRRARRTAALQTRVQFGGQEAALSDLLGQAKEIRKSSIQGAKIAGRGEVQALKKSIPSITRAYAESGQRTADIASDVKTALGTLATVNPSAAPLRAVTERELARQGTAADATKREALTDVADAIVSARAGRGGAINQARQTYNTDLRQIGKQLVSLRKQKGAYAASIINDLMAENRKAAREAGESAKDRASRLAIEREGNVSSEKIAAGKNTGGGGGGAGTTKSGGATHSELKTFSSEFSRALSYAKQFSARGDSISDAETILRRGTVASKNKKGQPMQAIGKIEDPLALNAALQVAYQGYMSPTTVKRIKRQRGIRPGMLPGGVTKAERRGKFNQAVNRSPGGDINQ